jgi:hypothetical protein
MGRRRWVLWDGLVRPSFERLILSQSPTEFQLSGLIIQAHETHAFLVKYSIQLDEHWQTREARIEIENGTRRSLQLARTPEGAWLRDGEPLPDLDGILDVDIEWSPSTNTLPIRRLALSPGEKAAVSAAWIRLPSLDVQRLEQSYERLDQGRYVYRSGDFRADLEADADGLITRYGVNWEAVAAGVWS